MFHRRNGIVLALLAIALFLLRHAVYDYCHGMLSQHTSPRGALGLNYNESLIWINHGEIRRIGTNWIRGFIDMHQIDSSHLEQDRNIEALLGAADAGFKTILSLKWNYADREFPIAGSPELAAELQVLDRLLQVVMGRVDILVIGNEPFIEAQPGQTGEPLNIFYETLAKAVFGFRNVHRGDAATPTRLYMGALNRLDLPDKRTPAIERMLDFIASRPELDGVDLHPHMSTFAGHKSMVDYTVGRIRPDQTFLATEFSMIWHWKKHMGDVASAHFRTRYGLPDGTKVYQVIDSALGQPMPFEQWQDFLSHEPWYMEYSHFISDAVRFYRSTGRLAVATYPYCPMRERKLPLQESEAPWLLNGVYTPSTVQREPGAPRHENFPWANEFRRMLE